MTVSRQTSTLVAVLLIAALSWALMLLPTHVMSTTILPNVPFGSFAGIWVIIMAAMMLPSFAPIATRYINMVDAEQWFAVLSLLSGYMSVQILTGFVAYALQQTLQNFVNQSTQIGVVLTVIIFAIAGLYQFTPFKMLCLKKSRAPFSQLLRYSFWTGEWRHFLVGVHHGAYCAGSFWALLLLAFAFGVMNITAIIFSCWSVRVGT